MARNAGHGGRVIDLPGMRDRARVFGDRFDAGSVLAKMLEDFRDGDGIVLAVPAGGVPVAAVIARRLELSLDVAVVSKITPPWNSEVGYGAVAFDGTVLLNEALVPTLGLSRRQIEEGIDKTREKVARRLAALRGDRPMPALAGRRVILVDDGLASGFTLLTAVEALRKAEAGEIILAVPTAHAQSAQRVAATVEAVYCPNVRGGWSFAVADAYRQWCDLPEAEAASILAGFASAPKED
jgi:putative phosphoribosyl transferase